MDDLILQIPDHCPTCNATLVTGWGKKIGTQTVGCTSCYSTFPVDKLKKLNQEKISCGAES